MRRLRRRCKRRRSPRQGSATSWLPPFSHSREDRGFAGARTSDVRRSPGRTRESGPPLAERDARPCTSMPFWPAENGVKGLDQLGRSVVAQAIKDGFPRLSSGDDPGLAETAQMLGQGRLPDRQPTFEVAHAKLPLDQRTYDHQPVRMAEILQKLRHRLGVAG